MFLQVLSRLPLLIHEVIVITANKYNLKTLINQAKKLKLISPRKKRCHENAEDTNVQKHEHVRERDLRPPNCCCFVWALPGGLRQPLLPLLPLVESPRSSFIEKEEEQRNALGSKGPTMHNTQRTVTSYSLVNKDCRLQGGSAPRAPSLFSKGRLKEKLARAPP